MSLVSETRLDLSTHTTHVKTYEKGMRMVFCHLPGPLCSLSIIVPTKISDDKGLPHTLEHLVFCGSKRYPRGYLDILATRCLSNGTNAYTSQDHTCFEITTCGWEGMLDVFPVFLDHLLNPLLTESQFKTEVYHLDGQCKHQGVVYNEMAAREDSEMDRLDLRMRQKLYKDTYGFECGGLTGEIQNLTNHEIIDYHKQYYHLGNMTAIFCGPVNPQELFERLEDYPELFQDTQKYEIPPFLEPKPIGSEPETVYFPSSEEEVGSVSFGWHGPHSQDIKTLLSLDVLFRYLNDTPASPFAQAFVELEEPYCADIDFEIKPFHQTMLMLTFSGVPEETIEDEEIKPILDQQLDLLIKKGLQDQRMPTVLKRHRQKIYEAMEEEPHELVTSYLVPDILHSTTIGTRCQVFSLLDQLEKEPESYWIDLVKNWLLKPSHQINMVPSSKEAQEKELRLEKEHQRRLKKMKSKLEKLKQEIDQAVKDNEIVKTFDMPKIPDASKAPLLSYTMDNIPLESQGPFSVSQIVRTQTGFVHLGIGLNLSNLETDLRPFLVLFQELLFQSPLRLPSPSDETKWIMMDYKEVAKYCADLCTSHEAGIGFQNATWTTGWLSQTLTLFLTSVPEHWERMSRFCCQVLFFTQFRVDRVLTVAKNLLSSLQETKRDADTMLGSIVSRLTSHPTNALEGANDYWISIFHQESFLKHIIRQIQKDPQPILDKLDKIRHHIITLSQELPHFIRLALPLRFKIANNAPKQFAIELDKIYTQEMNTAQLRISKRKRKSVETSVVFPFPRSPFSEAQVDLTFGRQVVVHIEGCATNHVSQIIKCDILRSDADYWPVVLLAELLTMTEGPLYTRIRGQGLAYGASVNCALWSGTIGFNLYRATEPQKALGIFHDLVKEMQTREGLDRLFTQHDIEMAQSSLAYGWISQCSTSADLIATCLRSSLQVLQVTIGI
ncbi:Metalloenzyme, LuxS/M16 peptidase-like protein [Gorgonomyces haynaldii]|nr:Metalloenzyme, LuxS/M16 peptidase-like protein [Gorgonomyces haynaldii]